MEVAHCKVGRKEGNEYKGEKETTLELSLMNVNEDEHNFYCDDRRADLRLRPRSKG